MLWNGEITLPGAKAAWACIWSCSRATLVFSSTWVSTLSSFLSNLPLEGEEFSLQSLGRTRTQVDLTNLGPQKYSSEAELQRLSGECSTGLPRDLAKGGQRILTWIWDIGRCLLHGTKQLQNHWGRGRPGRSEWSEQPYGLPTFPDPCTFNQTFWSLSWLQLLWTWALDFLLPTCPGECFVVTRFPGAGFWGAGWSFSIS